MKQILICVNYCHKNKVVHRDLKPGSKFVGQGLALVCLLFAPVLIDHAPRICSYSDVLLEEHKNLNHIKIIDFGEAVVAEPTTRLTEIAGTMSYMVMIFSVHTRRTALPPFFQ